MIQFSNAIVFLCTGMVFLSWYSNGWSSTNDIAYKVKFCYCSKSPTFFETDIPPQIFVLMFFVSQAKLVTSVKKVKSVRHSAHQSLPRFAFC